MNKGFYDGYHFRVGDALFGALVLIAILENSIVVFAIGGMVFDFGVASFSGIGSRVILNLVDITDIDLI
ncbi:hypothetical protein [Campylobacter hyointestinalis]|uniref:hypothetical protein n=1 Tax=Campylobacter hyointestinalis TaxID=198 RepID=UPI000DCB69B6|nr:hypothetical protein [Campylobacter hyointestinalis]RAZ23294.1 hypothetical protein CHL9752_07615 [Campylobacter hyointestinalis subsp. lawsonii]RAZ37838.1 hypothetical protein CHL9426_07770 [Campylobacter hyointestinalis subsp. lawsonii]